MHSLVSRVGDIVNIGVCVFVFAVSLIFVGQLEVATSQAAKSAKASLRVTVWAYWVWVFSWLFWILIYIWRIAFFAFTPVNAKQSSALNHLMVQGLSDIHSAFVLVSAGALILAAKKDLTSRTLNVWLLQTVALFLVLDFILVVGGLLVCGGLDGADALVRPWSMAMSVVSPLMFGFAFWLRYGTRRVLFIFFLYAFAQPFAYGAAFASPQLDRNVCIASRCQVQIPDGLGDFVQLTEKDSTKCEAQRSWPYSINRDSENRRMTEREARQILGLFKDTTEDVDRFIAYIRLRHQDAVFGFLGLMKLVIAAAILFYINKPQLSPKQNLVFSPLPAADIALVKNWHGYFWFFVLACFGIIGLFCWAHGLALGGTIGTLASICFIVTIKPSELRSLLKELKAFK